MSRRTDLLWALLASLLPLGAALLRGDPLFLGVWYYAVVFGAVFLWSALLEPAPLFTFGATLALLTTFVGYLIVAVTTPTDGLLGLGHLFSLPGAVIGLFGGWLVARKGVGYLAAMGLGFGAVLIGFFANQLILCNTKMWCGPLSFSLR